MACFERAREAVKSQRAVLMFSTTVTRLTPENLPSTWIPFLNYRSMFKMAFLNTPGNVLFELGTSGGCTIHYVVERTVQGTPYGSAGNQRTSNVQSMAV